MRSAIIGLGVIGKVHFDVLQKRGEEIVALCDIDPKKTAFFSGKTYLDYKEMLREENIDVVHVCTPHYLHREMVVFALSFGVNVLCEKPLGISLDDLDAILTAEKNSSAKLGVCFQNRYNNSSRFLKKYLSGKKIDSAKGVLRWHRDEKYYRSADWRGKWSTEGGGVLINQAIHTVDLLQWLVGMPQSVCGEIKNRSLQGVIEVEDTAGADFFGEQNFSVFATNDAPSDTPVELWFSVDGEEICATPDRVTIDGKEVDLEKELHWYGKKSYGNGHEKLIADFYESLLTGKKFAIDGAEGAKAVRLVLAVYKSRGKTVNID